MRWRGLARIRGTVIGVGVAREVGLALVMATGLEKRGGEVE